MTEDIYTHAYDPKHTSGHNLYDCLFVYLSTLLNCFLTEDTRHLWGVPLLFITFLYNEIEFDLGHYPPIKSDGGDSFLNCRLIDLSKVIEISTTYPECERSQESPRLNVMQLTFLERAFD